MKNKTNTFTAITIILTIFSIFSYYFISNYLSALLLIGYSIFSALYYKNKFNTFINCKTIFSFIFNFTIGLAMLRLHQDQIEWKFMTVIILVSSYIFFMLGYNMGKSNNDISNSVSTSKKQIKFIMNFILYTSIVALIIELFIRGYVPIFQSNMSSYNDFSVTGIHYFTVSGILYLPFAIILYKNYKLNRYEKLSLFFKSVISILIPIIIVSRQLLLMEIVFCIFILLKDMKKISNKNILIIFICILILFSSWYIVGKFRNQNEIYLRNALHIQSDAPISVQTMNIYMYMAFNYDNFNANVSNLEHHTFGYKSFFPFFALTGTKFIINKYFDVDYIRVVDVFTTYPIQMYSYSDFGLIGVILYMFLIGILCKKIEVKKDNAINVLYKCFIWYCLLFSFFTSFFSNATIVFMVIYVYILSKINIRNGKYEKDSCFDVNI